MHDLVGVHLICTLLRAFQHGDNCPVCIALPPVKSTWGDIDIYKRVVHLGDKQIDAKMTLTDKILGLPYQDRLSIYQALKQSLRRPVDSNRGNVLLGYMEEILGEPIKLKSGLSRFVWARTMVAYQLTQERFSTLEIGRMLGKDHTTIIYMRDKMQDALSLPQAYRDILPIWNEFKKRIDNQPGRRISGLQSRHNGQGIRADPDSRSFMTSIHPQRGTPGDSMTTAVIASCPCSRIVAGSISRT